MDSSVYTRVARTNGATDVMLQHRITDHSITASLILLGRRRRTLEDNINIHLEEIGYGGYGLLLTGSIWSPRDK